MNCLEKCEASREAKARPPHEVVKEENIMKAQKVRQCVALTEESSAPMKDPVYSHFGKVLLWLCACPVLGISANRLDLVIIQF